MRQPVLATWLLRHFGSARMNDPLMGDLMEERQSGRSRLWFWKQVLVAVFTGLSKDMWNHKILALRAIAIGWGLSIAVNSVWFGVLRAKYEITAPSFWVACSLFAVASGWVVAHLHRPYHAAMTSVYISATILAEPFTIYSLTHRFLKYGPEYSYHFLEWDLTHVVAVAGSILIGGLLAFPRGANSAQPSASSKIPEAG